MFDDVSQFLNLHRFVIKDSFPLAEESQFLQLSVSVGNVLADTFCDVDKVRFLLDGPGAPHGSIDLAATESLQRRPELRSPVSATVRHRTETQPVSLSRHSNSDQFTCCSDFRLNILLPGGWDWTGG